jgi:hypothetical protein
VQASSARFFCTPKPGQSEVEITRAPSDSASAWVPSVLPLSMTTTSSAQATLRRQSARLCASLRVISATERRLATAVPGFIPLDCPRLAPGSESMRVNQGVDAVFVLSVRSFADRIAHIRAELARHGIEFEFVFEFDANAIPPELIDRMFAPSDMKPSHQSLVLKHVRTWQLALERNLRRVLVFEDDAVLAPDFAPRLAEALAEAEALPPGWMLYLGRGNNQHVGARSGPALLPGGLLPATDALVFDAEAARRRLATCRPTRSPARPTGSRARPMPRSACRTTGCASRSSSRAA